MNAISYLLVVDDEPRLCKTLSMIICAAGYQTSTAGNAYSALQMLSERKADLLIMDWHLPDMDGAGLLAETRRLYPNLPVVVITANGGPEIAEMVFRLGGRYFLLKPFDPRVLISLVKDVLRSQRMVLPGNESFKDMQSYYTSI